MDKDDWKLDAQFIALCLMFRIAIACMLMCACMVTCAFLMEHACMIMHACTHMFV